MLGIVLTAIFSSAGASSPVVVPLTLRSHFLIIVVKIEGVDVPLLFDSGDQSTLVLHKSVFDHLKATPTGETYKMTDAKGNVIASPMFRVPHVRIGRVEFRDVSARVDAHDPSYQATQVGQDGFMGTGLFKSYEMIFDYRHRIITLVPRNAGEDVSAACHGTEVPFLPKWGGEPATDVDTDLGPMTVWWDTGSPTSLLSEAAVEKTRAPLHDGNTLTTTRLTFGGADFGPGRFLVMEMAPDLGFDGLIGYNFFARHVVCMDFPGKRLFIRK